MMQTGNRGPKTASKRAAAVPAWAQASGSSA